jgi:hypothetical protein
MLDPRAANGAVRREEESMSREPERDDGRLGFLGAVARLFRREEEARAPQAGAAARPEDLRAGLDAALRELNQRIDEQRRAATATAVRATGSGGATQQERAEASQRRMEAAHRAIRADVEAMHAQLGTGLASADLDRIAAGLRELAQACSAGKDSHELLPRARFTVGEKLRVAAGELAVERIVVLLRARQMEWPDPTRYRPGALPEEIERSRTRRLRDVRDAFLTQDFERGAGAVLGVVKGWRSDYPEPGTPLWEETVLEAVAAGLRGQLVEKFIEVLRRDQDEILGRLDASIGKQLASLQAILAGGVHSVEDASQAVAGCLRVLDEVLPQIAWEHLQAQLPEARGES